jgi:hypothetical protein
MRVPSSWLPAASEDAMTYSLRTHFDSLMLPAAAAEWLLMLWESIQAFDDYADGDPVKREALDALQLTDEIQHLPQGIQTELTNGARNLPAHLANKLLVAQGIASRVLPPLCKIYQDKGVELRGDEPTRAIVPMNTATEQDWRTEYLAPILSIRVVAGLDASHLRADV